MTAFPADATAVVVIDPLNDFVSRRGKGWLLLRPVALRVDLIANLRRVLTATRRSGVLVVYAPHHRYHPNENQPRFPNPSQFLGRRNRFFHAGRHGGEFHSALAPEAAEFVACEHPVSSAFGGTDLDPHLHGAGITHIVICGLLTNTCVESTVRQGVDLGYHVTVLRDAVASWSHRDHDAAIEGTLPLVAHQLMTVAEFERAIETMREGGHASASG